MDALRRFALLLSGNPEGHDAKKEGLSPSKRNHVQDIVKGVIEGETRVIVSSMTMEDIFKGRQKFKKHGMVFRYMTHVGIEWAAEADA